MHRSLHLVAGALATLLLAGTATASPKTPISTIKRGDKVLRYTFDDGPHPTRTNTVLDALALHNVKATFFINGSNVNAVTRPVLVRMVKEGHLIGSHQWDHDAFLNHPTSTVEDARFRDQVQRNMDLIATFRSDMPKYFRYPYGAKVGWKDDILLDMGYTDKGVAWHMDSLDWSFAATGSSTRPEVPANLKNDYQGFVRWHVGQVGGGILLHHDIKLITGKRLADELQYFKSQGFGFANLPE